jgi:hypothetical protein
MDWAVLLRLVPALAVAAAVGWFAVRDQGVAARDVGDALIESVLIGGVMARLAWVAIDGLEAALRAPTTVILLRSGVETWVGIGAAIAWALWRWHGERLAWAFVAAPSAALAGLAVWHAGCELEGLCAGVPAEWGVVLPGYLSPTIPAGYIEAAVAGLLAVVAFRARHRLDVMVGAVAAYALARGVIGFARAPLVSLPTRDQILSALAAAVLFAVAAAVRRRGRVRTSGEMAA